MYSKFQIAKKLASHQWHSESSCGHGIHSPFVYDFVRNVLNNELHIQHPASIESVRSTLLRNTSTIPVQDLGAGSQTGSDKNRSIASIARSALKPKKLAQILFRAAKLYKPKTIVELGTSLGLTTCYFSNSQPDANIFTIEGSEAAAEVAAKNFEQLGCKNIHLFKGNFDEILPGLLANTDTVELAYIDGNHRYEPTVRYFHQLVDHCSDHSVLIFDDIHWSREMEQAWQAIRADERVTCSIDIFFLGFVFFRKDFKVKQDFKIRLPIKTILP